jgi:methyl-accepting chemotaxis protein
VLNRKNRSLTRSLVMLSSTLMLMLLGLAALLVMQSARSKQMLAKTAEQYERRQTVAAVTEACGALTQHAIVWTMTRRVAERRQYEATRKACTDAVARLDDLLPAELISLKGTLTPQIQALTGVLESIQADHVDEAKMRTVGRLERQVKPLAAKLGNDLSDLERLIDETSAAAVARLDEQQRRSALAGGLISLFGLLAGVALTISVTRRLRRAFEQAAAASDAFARGDLSAPIVPKDHDEVGRMLLSLENARSAWVSAIADIHAASGRIAMSSSEIGQGASMLNTSAADASQRLEATSTSMDGLLTLVDDSTASARQANELASGATRSVQAGRTVVDRVASTMVDLQSASTRISDINSVIDSLAFQTNILALNAAVEAARAGEQGRGFAVVAAEVRALAQRSAKAAAEIRGLITTSVNQVGTGTEQALGANTSIADVGRTIEQVAETIGRMDASAQSQAGEIRGLATSIRSLSEMTQENAQMAQLWAGSATQLEQESLQLQRLVGRFRLPTPEPAAA